ncbi:MAG TPA: phosphoribosylglycinamide formyltransferase [Firmicutes bacterium]|nr:phosphoribosylglycinamide formyltransferase [Bacillota bacterium]
MKKIAVLVSGGGTNLQALIDAERDGIIKNGKITLVISSRPGVYALERAEKAGIKSIVLERKKYALQADFDADLLNALKEHDIDLVVLAGFLTILGDTIISEYKNRIINVHPSLIPSFCGKGFYGLKVHEAALSRGVKLTGATVHLVNEIADGGPILMQRAVEVMEDDTPETLQKRVMRECEHVLLPLAVSKFCEDKITVKGNIAVINP